MNLNCNSDWGLKVAVCKLDYKQQYKVCYDFYDEKIKYPQFDENKHCLKFDGPDQGTLIR